MASDVFSDDEENEYSIHDDFEVPHVTAESDPDSDSEDDMPLAQLAKRARNNVPQTQKKILWEKKNFYETPVSFTSCYGPDIDEALEFPVEIFECLFPEDLLKKIAFETNLYATQKNAQKGNRHFLPTTYEEVKLFIGVNLLMGVKKLPSLKDYWSSQEEIRDAYIAKHISRDRFYWLLSNLHLADNTLQPERGQENYDKLYKVRPLLDSLSETYKKHYLPGQFQAIDESMIKFKGRSSMKQYMPAKPVKRGYKVWVRADESGYICEFQIYTGKIGHLPEKDLGRRVVNDLTKELKNYHRIYFDNYFTSVPLLIDLKQKNLNACGTLKKGKKFLPNDFIDDKKLHRGECDWRMTDDGLLCLKWKDKKPVYFLSNFHDPEEQVSINRRQKDGTMTVLTCPTLVSDYNQHMGFVDKADMLKKCYAIDRKSKKWYHRIIWHFLDTTIINAYILFNKRSSGSTIDLKQFRINVATALIRAGNTAKKKGWQRSINNFKKNISIEKRLDKAAHLPLYGSSRRCAVCSSEAKTHRSMWACTMCNVALCLNDKRNCFLKFHKDE